MRTQSRVSVLRTHTDFTEHRTLICRQVPRARRGAAGQGRGLTAGGTRGVWHLLDGGHGVPLPSPSLLGRHVVPLEDQVPVETCQTQGETLRTAVRSARLDNTGPSTGPAAHPTGHGAQRGWHGGAVHGAPPPTPGGASADIPRLKRQSCAGPHGSRSQGRCQEQEGREHRAVPGEQGRPSRRARPAEHECPPLGARAGSVRERSLSPGRGGRGAQARAGGSHCPRDAGAMMPRPERAAVTVPQDAGGAAPTAFQVRGGPHVLEIVHVDDVDDRGHDPRPVLGAEETRGTSGHEPRGPHRWPAARPTPGRQPSPRLPPRGRVPGKRHPRAGGSVACPLGWSLADTEVSPGPSSASRTSGRQPRRLPSDGTEPSALGSAVRTQTPRGE